jgi:HAMP domain-containing protein
MGTAGYLRTRAILTNQASEQLTTSLLNQIDNISAWARKREIRLAMDANRNSFIASVAPVASTDASRTELIRARREIRNNLDQLRKDRSTVIFNELLLLNAGDGEILASTDQDMEGEFLSSPILDNFSQVSSVTIPVFDHAIISPGTLAVVTSVPMGGLQDVEGDFLLLGVTSGGRVIDVLSQIEITLSHRGVTQIGSVEAFIAIEPSIIVGIQRYTLSLEGQARTDHPIFISPHNESPQNQEYDNLDGVPVLGGYAWVPEIGIGIVVEVPQTQILAEINSLAPFSAILVSATVIFSVIVILLASGRILRPLQKLTEFAERMSRGDWRYRVPEEREDEIGVLASALNRMAEDLSGLYRSLEERVEERTLQVNTASEIARAVVSIPTMEELLRNAVDLIQERFGYHHVSIFLLDEKGDFAELAESTGDVGQALKARGHRIKVGSQSIIGWVTEHNLPRLATIGSQEPDPLENEFLPDTRSGLVIPLQVGGSVVGAMDVQSVEPNVFTDEAVEALQGLADQVCAAIQNTRLARISISAAERAQIISEVTRDMGGLMDIDEVLQSAARALHKALGEPELLIKLHTPEDGGAYPSEE